MEKSAETRCFPNKKLIFRSSRQALFVISSISLHKTCIIYNRFARETEESNGTRLERHLTDAFPKERSAFETLVYQRLKSVDNCTAEQIYLYCSTIKGELRFKYIYTAVEFL